MERNTLTTAGELSKGDRFYFPTDKKKTVYQITEAFESFSMYNRINAYGYKMLQFDIRAAQDKQVIFLRHKEETPII